MGLSLQSGFILPSTRPSEKSVAKNKFFYKNGHPVTNFQVTASPA